MNGCSPETEIVSSLLLDKHTVIKLDKIAAEIETNVNYDSTPLWELQSLVIPYHPHDRMKDIMTPILCARDEIEICNINYSGDYVILYCCRYLQEVVRYFLSIMHPVMKLRYKITPLGSLVHKVKAFNFIPREIPESLMEIEKLGRRCDNPPGTGITPKDAVMIYICSLLIGTRLLSHADSHVKASEEKCANNLYNIDIRS